jgi:hypothetical protein
VGGEKIKEIEMIEPIKYRCYVTRISGGFRAVCIDLDVAVENATLAGAILGLRDAMDGYLEVVRDGTATNQLFFPYRKAPLLEWVRYHFALQFEQ